MEKLYLQNELKGVCDEWLELFDLSNLEKGAINFSSPSKGNVFNAFKLFSPDKTRILIIGQDPYPKSNKACGLAFMHKKDYPYADASLKNIFKAIWAYKNEKLFDNAPKNLEWNTCPLEWIANNGILLLNTALTYEKDNKIKHQDYWDSFIKNIITNILTYNSENLAIFLWGKDSKKLFLECINSFGININDYNLANEIIADNKRKTNKITRKVLCLTTGHPTQRYDVVHKYGFSNEAPNHFKACDKFLNKDIWKDYPEES